MPTQTLTAIKTASTGKNLSTGWGGWNGYDNHLQVGATTNYKWRSFIRFPLWELPNNITEITDAQLRLTWYSTEGTHAVMNNGLSAKIKIGRMTKDWGKGNINPGEGNLTGNVDWNWDNRANTFYNSKVSGNRDQGAQGTLCADIDLLEITKDWEFRGKANYGIILINNTSETNDAYAALFYSAYTNTVGYRPELVVTYSTNTAPSAVTNTSPANGATINTLTPSFYGEMTDADNDDITRWQVHVSDSTEPTAAQGNVWNSGWHDVSTGGVSIASAANTITIPYGAQTNPYDPNDPLSPFGIPSVKPLEPGQTYYWKMELFDEGLASVWSSVSSFTTNASPNSPTVTVSPTPLSAVPTLTPNFSILHSDPDPSDTQAHGYTLTVQQETSLGSGDWTQVWSTNDVDISGTPASQINVTSTTLGWGNSYRVFARTQDSNGAWGPYSSAIAFQTQETTPPISLSPSGSTTTTATPTLSGSRGSSEDTIIAYSIEVYDDTLTTALLSETEYTTGTNGATFSQLYAGTALTAGQPYRWRAKVESSVGGYSDWSDWQRFVVQNDVTVPTITSPVGDNAYGLTPQIAFNRASNFNWFDVEIYPESTTAASVATDTPHGTDYDNSITSASSHSYNWAGTALEYATGYKIRVRVSADGGSTDSDWTGLVWFKTDSIGGAPLLDSVAGESANPAWITDSTPTFTITRNAGDANLIDQMQVRIWNANGTTIIWDSGMTDVTNSSSASLTYSGTLLIPGTAYKWDARYKNNAGPISPYSTKKNFRLNGPPTAPTGLFPPASYVYLDTETKTFRANFNDPDEVTFGDSPNNWEIYIHNEDTDLQHGSTQSITTGLNNGENSTTWTGTAFVNGTNYSWQTRFRDSKNEWGAWSASTGFRVSTPPNGTITTPTNDSNVSTVTPTINWNITGDQERYSINIDETNSAGAFVRRITTLTYYNTTTTSDSLVLPAGYLQDGKDYNITLTIVNSDNLADPSPSTVWVHVELDAPDPILNVDSYADQERSTMYLSWDQMSLKTGHSFIAYRIYRRRDQFTAWQSIGEVKSQSQLQYIDYYAGHNINYEYTVRAVTTKTGTGLELISGDDPNGTSVIKAQVANDDWHLIGHDRSPQYNSTLVVESETHNRPIQQEVFETIGSDRKVIMRGFVLGHEGELTTLWFNQDVVAPEDEQLLITDTYRGKRILDYLTRNAGPHILKSPFGDVWDVQTATPEYEWLPTGHLSVKIEWIETGTTSDGSEY